MKCDSASRAVTDTLKATLYISKVRLRHVPPRVLLGAVASKELFSIVKSASFCVRAKNQDAWIARSLPRLMC